MNRRGDIVDLDRAMELAPVAFGLGKPPEKCDVCRCEYPALSRIPYGPFVVWACDPCAVAVERRNAS